jgi:hypothetical protein
MLRGESAGKNALNPQMIQLDQSLDSLSYLYYFILANFTIVSIVS